MQFAVMAGNMEQGKLVIIFINVTVPSSGGIRVCVMARGSSPVFIGDGIIAYTHMMPSWIGVGMDAGAVAGSGKVFRRDDPAFQRWRDSNLIKELLQAFLEMRHSLMP